MTLRPLPTLIALGLSLGVLGACHRGEAGKDKGGPRAALVTVAAASEGVAPLEVEGVGHVQAIESVDVRAQVGGTLTRVLFREGDEVRKGQPLFQIDDRPLRATLAQAEAALARDLAQARRASEQFHRYASLYKEGGVSQDQYDQLRSAATSNEASVAADRAAVEQARVQLGYTSIQAPISGRVGNRLVTEGNVVRANDTQPLVVIHQLSPIDIALSVPEKSLPLIRQHQAKAQLPVQAAIDGDAGAPVLGKLAFIDNAVDPATGTIQLRGRFPNLDKRLWPGQFVRAKVTVAEQPNAILVPAHAVQTGQQGTFVFVVGSDQTAEMRPVTLDRTLGDRAVIAKGLKAGEMVITDGQLQVVPGGKVKIAQKGAGGPSRPAGGADAQPASTSDAGNHP